MSEDPSNTDKTKSNDVELIFNSYKGRTTTAAQIPWRNSIERVAAQSRFYDSVLFQAELPPQNEWAKILEVSQNAHLPSIAQRIRPSPLEKSAAALLTALAFSRREHRPYIVDQFLKAHDLIVDLRGRPRVAPMKNLAIVRGIQIQKTMDRLQEGFQIVEQARGTRRFSSDPGGTIAELKMKGYDDLDVRVLLDAKSLQDAACKHFSENNRDLSQHKGRLKLAQNAIALYKKMQRQPGFRTTGINPRSDSR